MPPPPANDPSWNRTHRFWALACLQTARGELKLGPLRDLAESLAERPLWRLVKMRLPSTPLGRLGFAVLLQTAERASNDAGFGSLLVALSGWREGSFVSFAALARALSTYLAEWLEPALELKTLAALGKNELLEGLADSRQSENLARMKRGVLVAAALASKSQSDRLLGHPDLGLEAAALIQDLIAVAVEAALVARESRRPSAADRDHWPDPDVMLRNSMPDIAAQSGPTAAIPRVNDEPPPNAARADPKEIWWSACQVWARDDDHKIHDLLDLTRRLHDLRLWQLMTAELDGLGVDKNMRVQQRGRLALAALLDEFVRAFPGRVHALLDVMVPRASVQVQLEHIGRFWQELDPLFTGWARTLEPRPRDPGEPFAKTLHRHGDILPWAELSDGKHVRQQLEAIERCFVRRSPHPEDVRDGAYWAANFARNDLAHGKAQRLAGRAPAVEMLLDVVALVCLAALRFRRALTSSNGGPDKPSLPNIAVIIVPKDPKDPKDPKGPGKR